MLRTITIVVAAALWCSVAQAQQITSIAIVDYGIYTADVTDSHRDAQGLLQNTSTNIRHAATTRTIRAEKGLRFGFRFRLGGTPQGREVTLKKITIYPPGGVKPPTATAPLKSDTITLSPRIGETSYTAYRFDDPWEMVPGPWVVQLWHGQRLLTEQKFTVVVK